jgi:DNA-binding transcriptional ArsR family regulator
VSAGVPLGSGLLHTDACLPHVAAYSTYELTTLARQYTLVLNQTVEVRMADQLSKVFAALGDPLRRDIITRLTTGDATVSQLAEPYDVSMQAVSKHLKVLEDAGLVSRGRAAQTRPVHLEAQILDLMTKWIERYQRQAEQRYRRLDGVLAEMNDTEAKPRRKGRAS